MLDHAPDRACGTAGVQASRPALHRRPGAATFHARAACRDDRALLQFAAVVSKCMACDNCPSAVDVGRMLCHMLRSLHGACLRLAPWPGCCTLAP